MIKHEWDDEDYINTLNDAFRKYLIACYGNRNLSPMQITEVRQAFLSGIHWLNSRDDYCPDDLQAALRTMLLRTDENRHLPGGEA